MHRYIENTFDAGGRKLAQQVFGSTPKVTDYMGEYIYEGNVLQFVNTEEGRIVMTGANPEYQYHLKDHLGNVRTTFTTVNLPDVNTATYEPANQSVELAKYLRLDKAKLVTAAIFDHTNGAASGTSERLNGSANEKFGIARSISVAAGDVISTEVYAKYVDPNSANWNGALTSLIGQIASGTVGVVVDGANYNNAINPFPYPGALAHTPSGTGPKAYLNWLVFDKNWTLDANKSGYMQMSTFGKEAGTDVAHERLFSPTINITEPGYVYVYLSNEETTPVDVYFDDLKVTQVKTPIVQVEDYYPFGLTFNSYQRDSSMPDQYLYNGKELQDELSLGWLDYGARMYMPELGRWGVVDPLSENMRRFSVYNYCWDNPLIFVDPDGMFGDVYNQQGTWVGTDNQDDKKKYVVKDGADPKDAVKGNTIDKTKVIEFVSGKDARAKMLEIANQDKADNSREYGGVISQSGDLIETSGEDGNIDYQKAKDPNAQENLDKLDGKVDKFHSHQSTQRDEEMNTSNGTVLVPVNKWNQKPSDGDKDGLKNNQTLYVFGMGLRSSPSHNEGAERVNIVYKDSNGNLSTASLPISRWVDQKERR